MISFLLESTFYLHILGTLLSLSVTFVSRGFKKEYFLGESKEMLYKYEITELAKIADFRAKKMMTLNLFSASTTFS